MPLPPSLDTFRTLANSAFFSSRDIAVKGEGKTASARLGNFVFSQSAKTNDATMKAFKAALEEEYGVFGRHAFDSVLGQRAELHKSLRACDVKATLSSLAIVRKNRFVAEANRQLDTAPKMLELSKEDRLEVRRKVAESISKGVDLSSFKTKQEVSAAAQRTIDAAISKLQLERSGLETRKLGPQEKLQTEAKPTQATGLRNLGQTFSEGETSIADLVKRGRLGEGMRVNRSGTNPVLLEKLKSNGVEPGFIYRNDWSTDDTRVLMADIGSDASLAELDALKAKDPAFAAKCEGKTVREQIMLAGRAHSAGMAAVAEFALQDAAQNLLAGNGRVSSGYVFRELAQALKGQFSDVDLRQLAAGTPDKALLKEAKQCLEKLTSPTTWVSKKDKVALEHLEVVPETRVPWKAALRGDDIAYYCETKMSWETRQLLEGIAKGAGARFETDELGFTRILVPKDRAEAFFAAFSEENVQKLTHPDEYMARKEGGDGLAGAKLYRPVPYTAPKADPRPLLDPAIYVAEGSSVTIGGAGQVEAIGGANAAGIGGRTGETRGTAKLNITGGMIVANGGANGSGIGAAKSAGFGITTISGGTIIATGKEGAAGIGGSQGATSSPAAS